MGYIVILAITTPMIEPYDDWLESRICMWLDSEAGQWAKEHSIQEIRIESMRVDNETILVRILADFEEADLTYWRLKYQ